MQLSNLVKRLIAEALGTFGLVFAGTGAIVINEATNGTITHVGVALTFGLIVLAMIYTFGDISGAHLNPAVTFGFWAANRMPGQDVPGYIGSQLTGAVVANASTNPARSFRSGTHCGTFSSPLDLSDRSSAGRFRGDVRLPMRARTGLLREIKY